MQSHSLGRTSLTGWNRDQAARKHLSIQAETPFTVKCTSIVLVYPILTYYVGLKSLLNP